MINKEISDKVMLDLITYVSNSDNDFHFKRQRAEITGQIVYIFNYKDAEVEVFEGCVYVNEIMVFGAGKNKLFPLLEGINQARQIEIRRLAEAENTEEIKRLFGYD